MCVLCTAPVPLLVDRHGLLAHCPNCNGVADKYVELETTIIVMDILLMKPEAFRHWVYNSMVNVPTSWLRLALLTTLFHVYISWAYHERDFAFNADHCSLLVTLALNGRFPYIYFLSKSILEVSLFCFTLSYLVSSWLNFSPPQNPLDENLLGSDESFISDLDKIYEESTSNIYSRSPSLSPSRPTTNRSISNISISPPRGHMGLSFKNFHKLDKLDQSFWETFSIISNTVLVSGIIKLFPIVMLIWPYDAPVLLATRLTVSLLHIFLLMEVINIIIPNKNSMFSYKTIFHWLKKKHIESNLYSLQRSRSKTSLTSNDSFNSGRPTARSNIHLSTTLRQRHQNNPMILTPDIPQLSVTNSPGKSSGSDGPNEDLTFNFKARVREQDELVAVKPPFEIENRQSSPIPLIPIHSHWKVVLIVLIAQLVEMVVTHIIIIWVASAAWNVTVRDVLFDDWRMTNLILTGIQEAWRYASLSL